MKQKSGWDLKTFEDAENHAKELTEANGELYIAVDEGNGVSPRYKTTRVPQVGDTVSYGFNGDYYPDGQIVRISKSLKVITTSTGNKFYRYKKSGSWRMHGTWWLVQGYHDRLNPSF